MLLFHSSGILAKEPGTNPAPIAYVNFISVDRNFVLQTDISQTNFVRITEAAKESGANGGNGLHERLYAEVTVQQAGYMYIYLSNDNPTVAEVYFDDFKVTQTKSPVIQTDDYYPFGLTFNSYARENSVKQDYLYNGKELQDELNLGWLDYGARMYMPELGRWLKMDKKAELYANMTPYCYAANTPTNAIDPDGNLVIFINGMSWGDGGSRSYWQKTESQKQYVTYQDGFGNNLFGGYERQDMVVTDFAQSFNDRFGQDMNKARFYDGAPWNSGDVEYRIKKGKEQGDEDIADIIQSLVRTHGVITEPLILATHSLGGAYGRGFLEAVIEYVKSHPQECRGLSISVYDFDPYDAAFLKEVYGVTITQIAHFSKFGLANQKEQGVSEEDGTLIDDTENSNSHAVASFVSNFDRLMEGKYVWNGTEFVKQ